jgi:hypothetical protein
MYPYTIQVADAGGLMAYDIDYPDLERRCQLQERNNGAQGYHCCDAN